MKWIDQTPSQSTVEFIGEVKHWVIFELLAGRSIRLADMDHNSEARRKAKEEGRRPPPSNKGLLIHGYALTKRKDLTQDEAYAVVVKVALGLI